MKRKFLLLIVFFAFIFALVACDNNTTKTGEIKCDDFEMEVGDSLNLNIITTISNPKYTYDVDGEAVKVVDGVVTALKVGTSYISITVEGYTASEYVKVQVKEKSVIVETKEYEVKYDPNNGDEITTLVIKEGSKLNKPSAPSKTGYTFAYWTIGDVQYDFSNPVQYNMTLVAKYNVNQYSLTIKKNNGEDDTVIKYDYNETIQEIEKPKLEFYSFTGWNTELPEKMPANDLTIEANWTPNKYTLTIKFNDNRTDNKIITQDYGTAITPVSVPSRMGYEFAGWNIDFPEKMPGKNIVIEAIWKSKPTTLTIKGYYEDGTDYVVSQDYNTDLVIEDPVKKGFDFVGYYTGENGTGFPVTIDKMFITDMAIYPNWKLSKWSIAYELNGGDCSKLPDTVDLYFESFDLPVATKEGYVFVGWYTDAKFNNKITAITNEISSNLTIYALWNEVIQKPTAETVEFTYNGEAHKPTISNYDEDKIVISGDYENVYNAGDYTTIITPADGYCWDDGNEPYNINWKINKLDLPVKWANTTVSYNGKAQTPIYYLVSSVIRLTLKNTFKDVGKYTAEVNYEFVNELSERNYTISNTTCEFEITPISITEVELSEVSFDYIADTVQKPSITNVKSGSFELTENDYEVISEESINSGLYILTINGKNNFSGSIEKTYVINSISSGFGVTSPQIYARPNQEIDLSEYIVNSFGTVTYTLLSDATTHATITDNILKLNGMVVTSDKDAEISIAIADSGDVGHDPATTSFKVIAQKYDTYITFDNDTIELEALHSYQFSDLNYHITTNATNVDYVGEVSYIEEDEAYLTLNGNIYAKASVDCTQITVNASSNALCKAASEQINVKINKTTVIKNITIDGLVNGNIDFNKTIGVNIESNYNNIEYEYKWYYHGIGSVPYKIIVSSSSTCKITTFDVVNKTICLVVKPKLDTAVYNDNIQEIIVGVVNKFTAIKSISFTGLVNGKMKMNHTVTANVVANYSGYSFNYSWFYYDAQGSKVEVSTTSSYKPTELSLIGKTIYVKITPNLKSGYYNDVIQDVNTWGAIPDVTTYGRTDEVIYLTSGDYNTANLDTGLTSISSIIKTDNNCFIYAINGKCITITATNTTAITKAGTYQTFSVYVIGGDNEYYCFTYKVYFIPIGYNLIISDYSENNGEIYVIDVNTYENNEMAYCYLPSYYYGKPVTKLLSASFNMLRVNRIYIPFTVSTIEDSAFGQLYSSTYKYSIYFEYSINKFKNKFNNVENWCEKSNDNDTTSYVTVYCFNTTGQYSAYYTIETSYIACLVEGTYITLANGSKKKVEDITYTDLLLVKDIINGGYTYEYPFWIEKTSEVSSYTLVTFDDGTTLKIKGAHSLFDVDLMMFVDNGSLLEVGHRVLKANTNNGSVTPYFATIVSIKEVQETVNVYNVFSASMYNVISDDVVTTFNGELINNYYTFVNDGMYDQDERAEALNDENRLYTFADYQAVFPYYLYVGFRANEAKGNILQGKISEEDWFIFMETDGGNPDRIIDVDRNENNERLFAVSTDNDLSSYVMVVEGSYYTLGECTLENNGHTFVGWRDSVTDLIYQAGDSVQINIGTHFIAVWE